MSWVTFSRPSGTARWHTLTQDYVLGYSQPSTPGLILERVVLTQTLQPVHKCFAMNSALAAERAHFTPSRLVPQPVRTPCPSFRGLITLLALIYLANIPGMAASQSNEGG